MTTAEQKKAWRKANPDKHREYVNKYRVKHPEMLENHRLKKRYGITLDDKQLLVLKQNNRCALCQKEEKLVVDHDHRTGKVRGLLCSPCNIMLGQAEKWLNLLPNVLKYLSQSGEPI